MVNLSSCSKDDAGSATSGNIVGKWELFKTGEKVGATEELVLYSHQAGCAKDNVEFKTDGTYITKSHSSNCTVFNTTGTYNKSGNNLTTTDGSGSTTVQIQELSNTTLKVYETYTDAGETFIDITVLTRAN